MSHELIYTSAPRGLKPGSRGFCTVASTPGMTQPLADRLESLSGYRHAFAAHDSQAALNPVNYSHLIVAIAGRKQHVLSRIQHYSSASRTRKKGVRMSILVVVRTTRRKSWNANSGSYCTQLQFGWT